MTQTAAADLRIEGPGQFYVEVIADSINPETGDRLTSFEARYPRFIHSEVMTHCLAGDTLLEFDMPTPQPTGHRSLFRMSIAEFVDKWQNGAAPRPNKGGVGVNRFSMRGRLERMRIRQIDQATGLIVTTTVVDARSTGFRQTYVVTAGGREVAATAEHPFLTSNGFRRLGELRPGDEIVYRRFGKREADLFDPNRHRLFNGVWRCQWQRDQLKRLRDEGGQCQHCEQQGEAVHHVVPVHVDPSRALDPRNIELVCKDCHYALHRDQSTYSRGGTYLYGALETISSIEPRGVEEVYDLEVEGPNHNFVANGFIVHNCIFAKNSASSRAIPVEKMLDRYISAPVHPVKWAREKKGMQGGPDLEGRDLTDAVQLWLDVNRWTSGRIRDYLNAHPDKATRLHKSVLNRLLEPQLHHTALITSATFGNFFDQRCHPDAQPEFKVMAQMVRELYSFSQPRELAVGDWHLPYMRDDELVDGSRVIAPSPTSPAVEAHDAREISSARCARTSYETQDGRRDYSEDKRLYGELVPKKHFSPLEHVATPWSDNVQVVPIVDPDHGNKVIGERRVAKLGKFPAFLQWRHVIEARKNYNSYR